MTQEEKAQAYDKAKARMSEAYNSNRCTIGFMNEIFPELKEGEDIRKRIIDALHGDVLEMCEVKEAIDWLKNQGGHSDFLSKIQVGDKVTRNEDGVLVNLSQLKRVAKPAEEYNITDIGSKNAQGKLGEMIKNLRPVNLVLTQDSVWSEEDELYIKELESLVKQVWVTAEQENDKDTIHKMSDLSFFLKTLKPQLKQEWNEKDEHILNNIYDFVAENLLDKNRGVCADECLKWLKSLRPQNTWKPSEKQKEALLWCVVHLGGADKQTLGELLEELNKL